ncbi:unnamed protein product [Adineta steineri]|uniref:Uncharacterized protein n=1 Tax=Adineta steineri TaxID=433720 RepID=A0A815KR41_9BILA|nr:unnamed protein product [Adineta steineri]CAF1612884.1 unnamed protein product [Adineta steineri]
MASSNVVSPYSESSNLVAEEPKPLNERVEYMHSNQLPISGHPNNKIDRTSPRIYDWLPWSITNICFGGILIGVIPLPFSLLCRDYKTKNNASSARTMSKLALIFNILATLFEIAFWITFIVLAVNGELVFSTYCRY